MFPLLLDLNYYHTIWFWELRAESFHLTGQIKYWYAEHKDTVALKILYLSDIARKSILCNFNIPCIESELICLLFKRLSFSDLEILSNVVFRHSHSFHHFTASCNILCEFCQQLPLCHFYE